MNHGKVNETRPYLLAGEKEWVIEVDGGLVEQADLDL